MRTPLEKQQLGAGISRHHRGGTVALRLAIYIACPAILTTRTMTERIQPDGESVHWLW